MTLQLAIGQRGTLHLAGQAYCVPSDFIANMPPTLLAIAPRTILLAADPPGEFLGHHHVYGFRHRVDATPADDCATGNKKLENSSPDRRAMRLTLHAEPHPMQAAHWPVVCLPGLCR